MKPATRKARVINNNEFKIEKGIPIPQSNPKYPFKDMKVGDSFLIKNCDKKSRMRLNSAVGYFKTRHKDWKFSIRAIQKDVRVWRIK